MYFTSKTPITKGWSSDRKYCVTDESGAKYLLRTANASLFNAKKFEFDMMKQVEALGIPMCSPIELGTCDDGVYTLHSWIDGVDAGDIIATLSPDRQYAYGLEAGRILRRLHSIPVPAGRESWEQFYNRKLDAKLQKYKDCTVKYDNGDFFIDYINANRHLLKGRPQVYRHGDYHRGNLMLGKDGRLYVIDFGRNDYGDPWEDHKSITWDVGVSAHFASGRIDGYFNGSIPEDFWKTLALYIFCGILSSAVWAIAFGEGEVQTMQKQAAAVLSWYGSTQTAVPAWYSSFKHRL